LARRGDYGYSVAVDASGNAFVAGSTESSTFPTTPFASDTSYNGNTDAFVAKLNAAGNSLVYSTFLGGSGIDWCYRMALDATGATFLIGYTGFGAFPTTAGAYDTTANGGFDAFVAALSPSGGTLSYSTLLGGSGDDYGVAIALNASGNVYVTGQTLSSNFPTTAGAFDTTYGGGGNYDVFVTKFSFGPIDTTPPNITASATPGANLNGWNNSSVTVTWTVTDAESPVSSQTGCGVVTLSMETPAAGTTLTCSATSAGGTASQSVTIRIDLTPPSISATRTPGPNTNGWNNTNVTVSFACSDGLSGVGVSGASSLLSAEGAGQSASYVCQDLAGNPSPLTISGINIDKTAPMVVSQTPSPNPAMVNSPISVQASLTDSGSSGLARADYRINAGPYALLSAASGAADTVTGSVGSIPEPAVLDICVQAVDLASNVSTEECRLVAVYDPNGGFVTGGGTFQSPPGAQTALPLATGRAQFAFESRYLPGATVPTGKTLFKFKTGNFEFDSTAYEWLVVAGARAQYKGEGVIKGAPGAFQFMLTAIDGQLPGGGGEDKFRLKITGPGGVVYDNQIGSADSVDPSTVIEGGSIVIHKQ